MDTAPECSREWEHLHPQGPSPFQLSTGPRVHDNPTLEMLTVTHPTPTPNCWHEPLSVRPITTSPSRPGPCSLYLLLANIAKHWEDKKGQGGDRHGSESTEFMGFPLWPLAHYQTVVSGAGVDLNENFLRLKGTAAPGHAPLWGEPRVGRFGCLCPALAA